MEVFAAELVPSRQFWKDALGQLAAADDTTTVNGILYQTYLKLFQNDFLPAKNSPLADFTEADFTGYTKKTYSTGPVAYYTQPDTVSAIFGCATFSSDPSDVPTTNTVYGCYLVSFSETKLYGFYRFPEPVVFDNISQAISVTPVITE